MPLKFPKPPGRPARIFHTVKFLQVNYASSELFCDGGLREVWGRLGLSVPPPEEALDDCSGALTDLLTAYGQKFPGAGRFNYKNAGFRDCEKPEIVPRSATE